MNGRWYILGGLLVVLSPSIRTDQQWSLTDHPTHRMLECSRGIDELAQWSLLQLSYEWSLLGQGSDTSNTNIMNSAITLNGSPSVKTITPTRPRCRRQASSRSGLYRHGCLDANLHPRSRQLRRSGTYATFRVQPGAEHTNAQLVGHRSSNAACIYPVDKFRDSNYGVEPNSRALLTLDGVTNPSVAAPTTPALTPTTPSRGLPFRDSSSSRYVHHVHALPGRALYRPPGIPVLVGSGSYSPTQQGIPTHRYGGPALLRHTTASNVLASYVINLFIGLDKYWKLNVKYRSFHF